MDTSGGHGIVVEEKPKENQTSNSNMSADYRHVTVPTLLTPTSTAFGACPPYCHIPCPTP